jgi:hypothetical protein
MLTGTLGKLMPAKLLIGTCTRPQHFSFVIG